MYIKCNGCKFLVEEKKLVLHLNNPKTIECKSSYSKSEYCDLLDYWLKGQFDPMNQAISDSKRSKANRKSLNENIECKGCGDIFKAWGFRNHLLKGCSEAYDEEDLKKLNISLKEDKSLSESKRISLRCRGCQSNIKDFKLILHLNNPKTECKKTYSILEQTILFEVWSFHSGSGPFNSNDIMDTSNKNALRCKGCLTEFQAFEIIALDDHIKKHPNCERHHNKEDLKYVQYIFWSFSRWRGWLKNPPETFRLPTADLSNADIDRILTLEYNLSMGFEGYIDESSKPTYIEYSAIKDFKHFSRYPRHLSERIGEIQTCAVILGFENENGYHSTEMIYPTNQDSGKYVNEVCPRLRSSIVNSKTFLEFKESARVLAWMKTTNREGYRCTGLNAQIQCNFKEISNNVISMDYEFGDNVFSDRIDFFELNRLGISVVANCPRFNKTPGAFCCGSRWAQISTELYQIPFVKYTYSNGISITNMIGKNVEHKFIEAPLFDKSYFATPPSNSHVQKTKDLAKNDSKKHLEEDESSRRFGVGIECRVCRAFFKHNGILNHLAHQAECKDSYSEEDLLQLKEKISERKKYGLRNKYYQGRTSNVEPRKHQSNDKEGEIMCKGCRLPFSVNIIKKHISHKPQCQSVYTPNDLKELDDKVLKVKQSNKKEYNKRYHSNKKSSINKSIECRGCGDIFKPWGFRNHLLKGCSEVYDEEDLKKLNISLKEHSSNVRKSINARYHKNQKDSMDKKVDAFSHFLEKGI